MFNKFKSLIFISAAILLITTTGCKKGTFDINGTNPNIPSSVPPNFSLSLSLKLTGDLMYNGNEDFLQYWMGYWSVSGDYIPSSSIVLYQLNTDFFSGNWDLAYLTLENYRVIENASQDSVYSNYLAISKIMQAFIYQRIVDLYGDAPYENALKGASNTTPAYTKASDIYSDLLKKIDTAINLIDNSSIQTITPKTEDILFQGNMTLWRKFANTLKLKILMRETETGNPSPELSGLTTADFLGSSEDASINPGYVNNTGQQSPQWADIGFTPTGSPTVGNAYNRANTYGVGFYQTNGDPRITRFYATNNAGEVNGRPFGSTELEHNDVISGIGPGILQSAEQDAVILPAFESLFLQAEAVQRGYISGDAQTLFNQAVSESFRIVGVPNYDAEAASYTSQPNGNTNYATSSNKIKTIITQKWAALNGFDPLESYSDWRRLNIPPDLPVSIYPGNTHDHIPYRLLYPTSEYNYNADNVNAEGTIDPFTDKIFWMP